MCAVEVFVSVVPLYNATADGCMETIEKELYCLSSSQLTSLITVGATSMVCAQIEMIQKFKAQYEPCNLCSLFCTSVKFKHVQFS
jgi:hypothetical protein